jgi:hypothetical protein
MDDTMTDATERLTLQEVATLRGVHYETARNWVRGVRGVRLRVERNGGRRLYTTREWLADFIERCTLGSSVDTTNDAVRRARKAADADRRIDALYSRRRRSGIGQGNR